jgi:ABC-2 type transport system permease protein
MKSIWTIAKKELKVYLYSPIAYILTAFFLLVSGFFFYNILAWANDQAIRVMQSGYDMNQANINQMLFEPFFNNMTIILMFLLPLLTMRLFADEKRMHTEELLLTSPVKISAIIIGKYMAALIIYSGILLLTATYAIFVFIYGNPELAPLLTAYLGLFLLGAVFIAIGLFASALTENHPYLGAFLGRRQRTGRLAGNSDLSVFLCPFQKHGQRSHRQPGYHLLPDFHFSRPLPDPSCF